MGLDWVGDLGYVADSDEDAVKEYVVDSAEEDDDGSGAKLRRTTDACSATFVPKGDSKGPDITHFGLATSLLSTSGAADLDVVRLGSPTKLLLADNCAALGSSSLARKVATPTEKGGFAGSVLGDPVDCVLAAPTAVARHADQNAQGTEHTPSRRDALAREVRLAATPVPANETTTKLWRCPAGGAAREGGPSARTEGAEASVADDDVAKAGHAETGYVLRDLLRVLHTALPRYDHLLSGEERVALNSFTELPLRARKLFARLLARKYPQWIPAEGLGTKYRELGETDTQLAVSELGEPTCAETRDRTVAPPSTAETPKLPLALPPWIMDTRRETAASLVARPIEEQVGASARPQPADANYGTLLLETLPAADLRQLGKELGATVGTARSNISTGGKGAGGKNAVSKDELVSQLRGAARQQRVLGGMGIVSTRGETGVGTASTTEERLVAKALRAGRWVCVAPTPGRTALAALTELFHLETSGVAHSNFLVFASRWPCAESPPSRLAAPLFAQRAALDAYLAARRAASRAAQGLEPSPPRGRPAAEEADASASRMEEELRSSLAAAAGNSFEASKLACPFRRRYTAAWCWAETLHHAVMHAPAAGENGALREAKVRRLRLLLESRLCVPKRGCWYNELAKEVARSEGPLPALRVAAEGLVEGEAPPLCALCALPAVDLTGEDESGAELPLLPLDARWDLARRCRALASRLAAARPAAGGARASARRGWQRHLRETPAAQAKGDGDRWLPALVQRLITEESEAVGEVLCISAGAVGLAQCGGGSSGSRRLFDGPDLEELTIEELALKHYLSDQGGGFACGIHCEGALLRDLFGVLLYDQLFDQSVEGVFASAFQDAPLDLGTEAFYASRLGVLERRFKELSALTPGMLAAEVRSCFAALYGTRVRGVDWDRYSGPDGVFRGTGTARPVGGDVTGGCENEAGCEASGVDCPGSGSQPPPPEAPPAAPEAPPPPLRRRGLWSRASAPTGRGRDLGAAAGAVGGRALCAVLRLLCADFNTAGLPDLLLWSWASEPEDGPPRARFVEVKSERDVLSRRQRLWLATLRGAGVEAEVCHVRDGPVATGEPRPGPGKRRRARLSTEAHGTDDWDFECD